MNHLKLLTLIILLAVSAYSQKSKPELDNIDNYSKSIDLYIKKYQKPQMIFADISQTQKERWRKFTSEKTLEKFREETETYSISYNWLQNKRIVFANFTLFSESGDWVNYVSYYFRPNGKLAKIETNYRTFYGHFVANQNIYFDSNGKVLKRTINYSDMDDKPINTPTKWLPDNKHQMAFNFYKTIDKLPYSHFIKTKN